LPSGQVIVQDRFQQYTKDAERAVDRALVNAAQVVAATARSAPSSSGYRIAGIQAKTYPQLRAFARRGGREVWIVNRDFRAVFFEKGTYGARKGALRAQTVRRRESSAGQQRIGNWGGNPGVQPQRFLRKGLTAGRGVLIEMLRRELS
jgi:hypothetical protein